MSDKKDKALKMARKALQSSQQYVEACANAKTKTGWGEQLDVAENAITAIDEALAEQPDIDWKDQYEKQKRRAEMWIAKYEADIGPLEKAGPVTAQQHEPVAWRYNGKLHEFDPSDWATGPVTPLYTSPPASKPWVSLTDEERRELRKRNQQHDAFAKAIDAALKEKNNG